MSGREKLCAFAALMVIGPVVGLAVVFVSIRIGEGLAGIFGFEPAAGGIPLGMLTGLAVLAAEAAGIVAVIEAGE